jgi:hypothetical protein
MVGIEFELIGDDIFTANHINQDAMAPFNRCTDTAHPLII